MVFVKDFKKDFYDVVQNQRVLILVAFDVDSLCACRILQYLFQCDHVLYTIIPVSTKQELERACLDSFDNIQYVILINCGATLDVIDMLQPPAHMVFYICDSHRPVDVHNIYNQVQVKLLLKEEEIESVPAFEDMFRDDEDDSENEDNSDGSDGDEPSGKRRRFDEAALERKREKRLWTERRQALIVEYTEFASSGTSAALLFYELAWKLSRETNDLLWLAIVGVTEQYINHRIDRDSYIDSISLLQPHVSRLNHRPDNADNAVSIDCLKISFDQELQLVLYRHWSLIESICHSEYMACKFVVWTMKGKKRLHEFLADMGLPLVQCRQKFHCMDSTLRDSVKEMIIKYSEKYGISEQELFLPSFHAQYGYKNKFCAADIVRSCEAYLESTDPAMSSISDNFLCALDNLNRSKTKEMMEGLELAKLQMKSLVLQAQTFLEMNQVVCAGPFLYTFVQQGSPDAQIFTKPNCLCRLAKFALEAYCVVSRNKKAKLLPMVLGTHLKEDRGSMLLVGIPPVSDRSRKNCFGKAFEQAAISSNSRVLQDYFDSNVLELKLEDKSKFFDTLIGLLQE